MDRLGFVACLVLVLSGLQGLRAAEPTLPPVATMKESQRELRRCVTAERTNAVMVLLRGFNWSSGAVDSWREKRNSVRPDLWEVNEGCAVKGEGGLYFADPNPFAEKSTQPDEIVKSLKQLYLDPANHGRPLIVMGHSMGGAYLRECLEKFMAAGLRPDFVIAIDAVSIPEQAVGRIQGALKTITKGYFGTTPTISLDKALPYGLAHLRAAPTNMLDSANLLRRVRFSGTHQGVEYTIRGLGHTTIDGDAQAMQLVRHLVSLVPAKGLNRGAPATPADYKPVKLPTRVQDLPPKLQEAFKETLTIQVP